MKVIVKYYGSLDGVRAIDDSVKVAELLAQYAIVDIDAGLLDRLRDVPEVIYIEEPRRVYPTDRGKVDFSEKSHGSVYVKESMDDDSDIDERIKIMQSGAADGGLSGKGVIMGIIDSGDCVKVKTDKISDSRDVKNVIYRAAAYIRLSRRDKKFFDDYSDSVLNQKKLINDYILRFNKSHMMLEEQHRGGIILCGTYIDDGYSGQDFDRPEFRRMICDIENRNINCIIVKDMSRIGRDYIEVGRFLKYYLKSRRVRFISIADDYDSAHDTDFFKTQMYLHMKSIINDEYSRDISVKVRAQLRISMKKGRYVGAFAPYGYKKSPADKNKLIPDSNVTDIIRKVFELRNNGFSLNDIAAYLNDREIPTPFEQRKLSGEKYKTPFEKKTENGAYIKKKWFAQTVKRILENGIYAGNMAQGKNSKINYKLKKTVKNEKDKWIVCEKKELAIIDSGLYEKVNKK